MGSPPINKNGHDQAQDREIRELRAEFREHIAEEMGEHQLVRSSVGSLDERNAAEHSAIVDMLHKAEVRFTAWAERIEGRITMHRTIAMVAYLIVIGLGGALMQAHLAKLTEVAMSVQKTAEAVAGIDKRQEAWEKFATKWGDTLDTKDKEIEERHKHDFEELEHELKDLRRGETRHRVE